MMRYRNGTGIMLQSKEKFTMLRWRFLKYIQAAFYTFENHTRMKDHLNLMQQHCVMYNLNRVFQ